MKKGIELLNATPDKKNGNDEMCIDLISKFNSVFEMHRSGKLPDEIKISTLDYQDLLVPLLTVVSSTLLDNIDLMLDGNLWSKYEESIFFETAMLFINSLHFKYAHVQVEAAVFEEKIAPLYEVVEDQISLSFDSDPRNTSISLIRTTIDLLMKVAHPLDPL